MKARYYLLGCLALAACDEATRLETAGPVVVNFAQPFPTEAPDLPGFLPHNQGQYTTPGDTSSVFVLAEKALIHSYAGRAEVTGAELDSLRIPRRVGSGVSPKGQRYSVQRLATDSFRLRLAIQDTVLNFTSVKAPRLRYYKGHYYTSTPTWQDSTKWMVRRLAVANGRIKQQLFNPDSLRVRALDPATVQRRRANGQLVFTLAPQSRRAIGQVSSYAGLWLDLPLASAE
jgi:hypothetical protein